MARRQLEQNSFAKFLLALAAHPVQNDFMMGLGLPGFSAKEQPK